MLLFIPFSLHIAEHGTRHELCAASENLGDVGLQTLISGLAHCKQAKDLKALGICSEISIMMDGVPPL